MFQIFTPFVAINTQHLSLELSHNELWLIDDNFKGQLWYKYGTKISSLHIILRHLSHNMSFTL